MSTPTPGRRERKKAETRARIQQAALDLFEGHSYCETSIEQISDLADVSTTTFFRYFDQLAMLCVVWRSVAVRTSWARCGARDAAGQAMAMVYGLASRTGR